MGWFFNKLFALFLLDIASSFLARTVFSSWRCLIVHIRTCQSFRAFFLAWGPWLCSFFFGRYAFVWDDLPACVIAFGNHYFFGKTKIYLYWASSLFCGVVCAFIWTIDIEISFEPLDELKIVLVLRFRQFLYLYMGSVTSI